MAVPLIAAAGMKYLPLVLKGASMFGKLLGGGAKKSADGRRDDAYQDANLAAINNRGALDTAGHNLDVSRYNLQAPDVLAQRSVGAARMLGYAPRGSHPAAKGFAAQLQDPAMRDAILKRLITDSGDQLGSKSYMAQPMAAPSPVARQKAGLLEKIGGFAGVLGGIAGGISELRGEGNGASTPSMRGIVPNIGTGVPDFGTPANISAPKWRTGRVPKVRF